MAPAMSEAASPIGIANVSSRSRCTPYGSLSSRPNTNKRFYLASQSKVETAHDSSAEYFMMLSFHA